MSTSDVSRKTGSLSYQAAGTPKIPRFLGFQSTISTFLIYAYNNFVNNHSFTYLLMGGA